MVLSTVGAAYGTSKAGIGIAGLGTFRYVQVLFPVVLADLYPWQT
jgi:V-type H+-transporting ATPase proteolipid subunit